MASTPSYPGAGVQPQSPRPHPLHPGLAVRRPGGSIYNVYTFGDCIMLTRMRKWGNSYTVRLPSAVVQETGIREGEALQVEVVNRHIQLRRPAKRKYALDELVTGIRRSNLHGEVEFGAPEGREAF